MSKPGRYGKHIKKHVHTDGTKLDSKREYQRYCELLLLVKGGYITELKVHPKFPITIGGIDIRIKSTRYHHQGRHLRYEADFRYFDMEKSQWITEDCKMASGHRTEIYRIKKALVEAMGITIFETS